MHTKKIVEQKNSANFFVTVKSVKTIQKKKKEIYWWWRYRLGEGRKFGNEGVKLKSAFI